MLGFGGYIALGAMYHILPLVTGRSLYSTKLVNLQFGLITFGLIGFFLVLTGGVDAGQRLEQRRDGVPGPAGNGRLL